MSRFLMSSALRQVMPGTAARTFTSMPASAVAAASRTQQKVTAVSRRSMSAKSTDTGNLYNYVFKHTWVYTLYCVCGAIVLDAAFGSTLDSFWEMNNKGRTYETVDWSKFESLYVPDEDEDEEEDDE